MDDLIDDGGNRGGQMRTTTLRTAGGMRGRPKRRWMPALRTATSIGQTARYHGQHGDRHGRTISILPEGATSNATISARLSSAGAKLRRRSGSGCEDADRGRRG